MMRTPDRSTLLLALASGVAGHLLVLGPLADRARALLRGPCPAAECRAVAVRVVPPATYMRDASPWGGPFQASSMDGRDLWRGRFAGSVRPMGSGLVVEMRRSEVLLTPEASTSALRGVRIDLAEGTPDGSWRIVREGHPVEVGMRIEPGRPYGLPPMDLVLPDVAAAELTGRWLVATMLVDPQYGSSPVAHAHMAPELARGLARRAIMARERAPDRRLR